MYKRAAGHELSTDNTYDANDNFGIIDMPTTAEQGTVLSSNFYYLSKIKVCNRLTSLAIRSIFFDFTNADNDNKNANYESTNGNCSG